MTSLFPNCLFFCTLPWQFWHCHQQKIKVQLFAGVNQSSSFGASWAPHIDVQWESHPRGWITGSLASPLFLWSQHFTQPILQGLWERQNGFTQLEFGQRIAFFRKSAKKAIFTDHKWPRPLLCSSSKHQVLQCSSSYPLLRKDERQSTISSTTSPTSCSSSLFLTLLPPNDGSKPVLLAATCWIVLVKNRTKYD